MTQSFVDGDDRTGSEGVNGTPEGVIRYAVERSVGAPPSCPLLVGWHGILHRLGVVGRSPVRYGGADWGNVSVRTIDGFVITASQRSGEAQLGVDDLVLVTHADPAANRVRAHGRRDPSSEALSHAALYAAHSGIGGVVHGHSPALWRAADALGIPGTARGIEYGTPRMADALTAIVTACGHESGIARMAGHEDGVISWGATLDDAALAYIRMLAHVQARGVS